MQGSEARAQVLHLIPRLLWPFVELQLAGYQTSPIGQLQLDLQCCFELWASRHLEWAMLALDLQAGQPPAL